MSPKPHPLPAAHPDPAPREDGLPALSPDHAEENRAAGANDVVPARSPHQLPVVGIGGSAGSIFALQKFFAAVQPDSGFAYVVIIHLSPEHESTLAEILQPTTAMPVRQVHERTEVKADCVYVIPPGKHLSMTDGHIFLSALSPAQGRRVAVDLFFRTLADTHGARSVAVVLSGAASDGAIGIKRMKERGGLTIAQDPAEAEHPSMPQEAIATGMVDWVLRVEEMPERLARYRASEGRMKLPPEDPESGATEDGRADAADEHALREVLGFLRVRIGHDFSYYKRATVLRRIARRMQVNGVDDLPHYLNFLRTHPGEAGALLQDLLISVTNFFRDRTAFEALAGTIPALFEGKSPSDAVRVWVPACATGEEAYSLAILLTEYAGTLDSPPSIQVFATDIDQTAIAASREGAFPDTIAADVSEERLRRFFHRDRRGYRVRRELRETVMFAAHDLLRDAPFSRLDLISCRNLLIYLNRQAQQRAFEIFHFALRENGLLFLSVSESAEDAAALFSVKDKANRIHLRRPGSRAALSVPFGSPTMKMALEQSFLPPRPRRAGAHAGSPLPVPAGLTAPAWGELHFQLLERLGPPSLLVNHDYAIVHLSESAGRFLHFTGGEPSVNLLRVVHPKLRLELRAALFQAVQTGAPVDVRGLALGEESGGRLVDIGVRSAPEIAPDLLLVVFREQEQAEQADAAAALPAARTSTVEKHLEDELEHVRERLRETVEQYEAQTEELKASNEELQAMNEELRSATEELETGREELQSINEELTTVNQQLKVNVQELARSNSDLQNLMASTNIATIFLDRALRIQRFTPPALALFNLIPTDVGRPLTDLTHRLEFPDITEEAGRVFETLSLHEREVGAADGRWFLARMLPHRADEDRIAGVVLTFIDITRRKQAEADLVASEARLRRAFQVESVGVLFLDVRGGITDANDAFLHMSGHTREDLDAGRIRREDMTPPEFMEISRRAFDEIRTRGQTAPFEREYLRADGTRWWGVVAGARISDEESVQYVMDITAHKTAETSLEQTRGNLRETEQARHDIEVSSQAKDHFLAVLSHELRTPLTPVIMAVQSLGRRTDLPPAAKEAFEMIRRNVLIEAQFIDDLLDLTRIERGKLEIARRPADVHAVIRAAIEVAQPDIEGKSQQLAVSLEAARHELTGDPVRLQQVVWNVLKNASKFTPEGGRIEVSTENEGERLLIFVTDNGAGIEPAALERIFEAFAQESPEVTRNFGGLGLGLAIARAIVEAHGGRLRVHSEGRGWGAQFVIDLPLDA